MFTPVEFFDIVLPVTFTVLVALPDTLTDTPVPVPLPVMVLPVIVVVTVHPVQFEFTLTPAPLTAGGQITINKAIHKHQKISFLRISLLFIIRKPSYYTILKWLRI